MYIYQTAPNRLFPNLVPYIRPLMPRSYQVRQMFSPREHPEKADIALGYFYKIYTGHPYRQIPRFLNQKDVNYSDIQEDSWQAWFDWYKQHNNYDMELEFIYGTFPGKLLNSSKKEYDFSFTFLDHPIKQFQNLFSYIKKEFYIHNKAMSIGLDNSHDIIPYFQMDLQNFLYIDIYKQFRSYEKYVDAFIDYGGYINLEFWDIKYQIPPENIGRYASHAYKKHDLYGIIDDHKSLDKSFRLLKETDQMKSIPNDPIDKYKKPSKILKYSNYRIDEITKILKEDIDFFMEKKSELDKYE